MIELSSRGDGLEVPTTSSSAGCVMCRYDLSSRRSSRALEQCIPSRARVRGGKYMGESALRMGGG